MTTFRPGVRVRVKAIKDVPHRFWLLEGVIVCVAAEANYDWTVKFDNGDWAFARQHVLVPIDDTPLMGSWQELNGVWQPSGVRA